MRPCIVHLQGYVHSLSRCFNDPFDRKKRARRKGNSSLRDIDEQKSYHEQTKFSGQILPLRYDKVKLRWGELYQSNVYEFVELNWMFLKKENTEQSL